MAKKQPESCDFQTELKRLRAEGPGRLYFIYGPEDYLSSYYLDSLRSLCLPDGDDGFSYKRFDGPDISLVSLQEAVDAIPFLSERIFVELRNIDVNKLTEPDNYIELLKSIPDYCTVVFSQDFLYSPDSRLKFVKFLKTEGISLCFDRQNDDALVRWIRKRFAVHGKNISDDACRRLMFISGSLMNRLIPEIDKISGYAAGDTVSISDIDSAASRIPEADAFQLISLISRRKNSDAARLLSEILSNKDNEPIAMLGMLSYQLRRTYGVKLVLGSGGGYNEVSSLLNIGWRKAVDESMEMAKGFSASDIRKYILACAKYDYKMKSSSSDDNELLKELVISFFR